MVVVVRVNNQNSFDVPVRNGRVNVVLADRVRLPPMAYSPNQWLPADGTTLVRVPMLIPWGAIPPLLAATVSSSIIPYRVQGEADVTAIRSLGIRRDNYPVDEEGEIPRIALLQIGRAHV